MKTKLFMAAAITIIALPAMADFTTVSRAYEVALDNLTVPPSQSARVMFKECDDCDVHSVRMTPNTRFVVNGRVVGFDKFRSLASQTNDAQTVPVTVLHNLESNTIVSVSVTLK